MKRKIMSFAFAALLAAGCAKDSGELVFAVGGAPNELDFWEEIAASFSAERGVEVKISRQPTDSDQRRQSLLIPFKAGKSNPDVFLMDIAWIPQFSSSGWLADLDASAAGPVDTSPFWKNIVDMADRRDGRLEALPVYVDAGLLYYRKDILEKYAKAPPVTWEELAAAAGRAQKDMRKTDPSFSGFVWQGAQYEGLVCNFMEFAGREGGLKREDGRIKVDTPENLKALEFMRSLVSGDGAVSPPNTFTEMKEEEARLFFQKGSALFERNWPYAWGLHQEEGSPVRGKTGICPLPSFDGKGTISALGGWHIGVSRFSDQPEMAAEFARYAVSYAVQKQLSLKLGWNPARKDVYQDEEVLAAHPHFAELSRIFSTAVPRPALPYYSMASEALQRGLNAALSGRLSPADALRQAQEEMDRVAERYGAAK